VSENLKQRTLEFFDIKKEILVIPNFIDKRKYNLSFTDCQRSLMAREDEKIITHISNFRKVKRIPDVIRIFNEIQKKIPAKLIMVGEGPEKEDAEMLCSTLGLGEKVVFLGNSNQIDRILCFSDLFLLPSESESFGLAALEAMINKVPVISSNAGGIPEVNIDGVTGFLSDVGQVEEMAHNALLILKDPEVLEKFKNNAFESAQRFDISKVLPLYEAVYEKAYNSRFKNTFS
jgi:N-acetyl-alpha-D-glucosaminyl L-malate synthase BshA